MSRPKGARNKIQRTSGVKKDAAPPNPASSPLLNAALRVWELKNGYRPEPYGRRNREQVEAALNREPNGGGRISD